MPSSVSRSRTRAPLWAAILFLSITTGWTPPAASPGAAPALAAVQLDGPGHPIIPAARERTGPTPAINVREPLPERPITAPASATREPAIEATAERAPSETPDGKTQRRIRLEVRARQAPEEAAAEIRASKEQAPSDVEAPANEPQSPPTFSGKNRFWMPALGISKRVLPFACSRTTSPDDYIYRWGCAGENNVYILGHAHSVMEPLHDAYVAGSLRKGMVAVYADDNGDVRKYKVKEWRVVDPTDSAWAIAAQARPSMTLQTCVGKNSQWRLLVRLVAVD